MSQLQISTDPRSKQSHETPLPIVSFRVKDVRGSRAMKKLLTSAKSVDHLPTRGTHRPHVSASRTPWSFKIGPGRRQSCYQLKRCSKTSQLTTEPKASEDPSESAGPIKSRHASKKQKRSNRSSSTPSSNGQRKTSTCKTKVSGMHPFTRQRAQLRLSRTTSQPTT
jgi:hypothetical protein